jgi:hypothetical protein
MNIKATLSLRSSLCAVALAAAPSLALATPIYAVDVKIGEAKMSNSSDAAELDMLRKLSGDNTLVLDSKTDANATSASPVPDMPGAWYLTDLSQPGYFALKFGTGGTLATATTFFFRNTGDLSYLVWTNEQVQFLTGGACARNQSKCNIGRLSHYTTTVGAGDEVSEPGSVPEPGSIALLGLGLLAAGAAAKRRNKVC